MLTRWKLANFKPIRAELDLPTAPLTVLAGLNSSGKSSFLQSILLVSQTLANQNLDEPLVLNGQLVRLGKFLDVCNDRAEQKTIHIGFALDSVNHRSINMHMEFEAVAQEETSLGLSATRAALVGAHLAVDARYVHAYRNDRQYVAQITDGEYVGEPFDMQMHHFVPVAFHKASAAQSTRVRLGACAHEVVRTFSSSIRYLGPLRVDPNAAQTTEMYAPSGHPDDVGLRGEFAAAVHSNNRRQVVRYWNPIGQQVDIAPLEDAMDVWLNYLGVAAHVGTRDATVPNVSWVVRSTATQTRDHALSAVGVGVSQVLPILVAGLLAPEGTILIMEQPELHLHERPQARLGDFFYGLTRVGKQVFVETHSAVLINQLRYLMVKRGQEARDAIAIYFVEQDEQGDARFDPIRIGKGGAIENWPDGFFDESLRQEDRITEEGLRNRGKSERA